MKHHVSDSSSNMSRDDIEVVNRNDVERDEAKSAGTTSELVTVVGAGPAGLMLG